MGTTVYANECTSKQICVPFARILVQTDITKPIVQEVIMEEGEGITFKQKVQYEYVSLLFREGSGEETVGSK